MAKPVAAFDAQVKFGSTRCFVKKWTVKDTVDMLDSTTMMAGGYGRKSSGVHQADIMLDGLFNIANDTGELGIVPGALITNVTLFYQTGVAAYTFPKAVVLDLTRDAEVRGFNTFSLSLRSEGAFTPAGDYTPEN